MLEEQEALLDPKARTKKLQEFQRHAAFKMYYVPTAQGINYAMTQPRVMDWNDTVGMNQADVYRHVWFKEK